jgi:UDPglucose 6-dehydrogenase
MMKICVLGLWHLGSVTAACCARHFDVTGLDFDDRVVADLNRGQSPVLEPGLNDLLQAGLEKKTLRFTTDAPTACAEADVLWVCYDTPVNDRDEPDPGFVLERLRRTLAAAPRGMLVLISSQLCVGTCAVLAGEFTKFHFACSPENLRLGKALEAFEKAERVVVGIRDAADQPRLQQLFEPFTSRILFMRTESAEMVKHALNSFLAASIAFINEVARLCEHVGADAKEVSAGLKSEPRIGPKAYLGPGGPFAGGTLARDVVTLTQLAAETNEAISLIPAIKASNDLHREWALRRLQSVLGELSQKKIAVLGLVYTPNTDTLRRSAAIELCRQLTAAGAIVQAYDPAVSRLPAGLSAIVLADDLAGALSNVDAAVVCTEWPQFREADWTTLVARMRRAVVIDPNRFLDGSLKALESVHHISVGVEREPAPESARGE